MAKIEKPAATQIAPPKRKAATKPKASTPATTSKPAPADVKPIQFKVSASMHQELKLYAVEQGMSMTNLFLEMYKEYRAKHG
jgi:hypothetical protein